MRRSAESSPAFKDLNLTRKSLRPFRMLTTEPFLLSVGFTNWSSRTGVDPPPYVEAGYSTEHNKIIVGGIQKWPARGSFCLAVCSLALGLSNNNLNLSPGSLCCGTPSAPSRFKYSLATVSRPQPSGEIAADSPCNFATIDFDHIGDNSR
jgi:hypothetical protein